MSKYLYGAAVQGIQEFIFQTNKLQHIVGASELVAQICTSAFDKYGAATDENSIVRAAGNIKYIFDDEKKCRDAVLNFPKTIMQMAPGITISQAVTFYEKEEEFGAAVDDLEKRLKTQRNKPPKSVTLGLMGIKRANNTGLPVVKIKQYKSNINKTEEEFQDESTVQKEIYESTLILCKKSFGFKSLVAKNVSYDISDIKGKNDWIAIIHADGNGLGKVVQKVGKQKGDFKEFSQKLDKATEQAANAAFEAVYKVFSEEENYKKRQKIPIRPVVLSGDDMTVIIRGDLALLYAKTFIVEFEKKTEELLGDILEKYRVFKGGQKYLTACAGIAFIKASYPFYYGYQLAEELCGHAKKDTKAKVGEGDLPASCLMFHKVQDSFITNYSAIVDRELTAKDGLSFKAGPYYTVCELQNGQPYIALKSGNTDLEACCEMLRGEGVDGVKSGLRNWISLRLTDAEKAKQRRNRMRQIFTDTQAIERLTEESDGQCIAYDVLAYHTIMNQETNK